jgi:nucleotide-binding universal stress UspA family protein
MTTKYRIVVGVDGSESGERALRWAVREAAHRPGATVQAVLAYSVDGPEASTLWYRERCETNAHDLLGAQVAHALNDNPRVHVTTRVVQGDAVEALLAAAQGADVLVLGSHGHSRIFHAVLGSVADACVRGATCPVLVVPAPHAQRAPVAPAPTGVPAGIL